MVILEALRTLLRNTAGVTAIVGQRSYKRRAPQRAPKPYVTLALASVDFLTRSQKQREAGQNHKITARVQVDCYSTDEDEIDTLSDAVARALDDYRGTTGGVTIYRSLQQDERDNYEPLADGSDVGVHRVTQDYKIEYLQPT